MSFLMVQHIDNSTGGAAIAACRECFPYAKLSKLYGYEWHFTHERGPQNSP